MFTSFYNVPGIYGSSIVQVENYLGLDCSDLLTAAYEKSSGKKLKFTSAGGLLKDVDVIEDFQYLFMDGTTYKDHEQEGEPDVIKYGKNGIEEGDIIFFCYSPDTKKKKCKRWHHVGAIVEDSGPGGKPDKILNGDDIILHAGPREPHLSKLSSAAFVDEDPTAVIVGRWK